MMNATDTTTAPSTTASDEEKRILIVDDERAMQVLASTIVDKLGYQAVVASSGEEAIANFRKAGEEGHPFTAVVMDLALPGGISGLEATLSIKELDSNAKVIVSSGYLEQNARNAALENGFAGILPKPYTADRLASELRWVVKQAES